MNDLAYLIRQMKAPRIADALPRVAEQARREEWSYEDFLTALLEREVLARQAQGREARENVIFLGPPGTGKTHLAIALGLKACLAGYRVNFATATQWVTQLAAAHHEDRLEDYLRLLQRTPLIIVDEVGYIPFDAEAANLFFQLVSSRYERGSVIVTSNKPFTAWGEIFGDAVVAAAMIDRLVHHADILSLKGESYRLKDKNLADPGAKRAQVTPSS